MAPRTVTFVSKFSEHSLTRRPHIEIPVPDGTGGYVTRQPAERFLFKPGLEDGRIVGIYTAKVGANKHRDHSGWLAHGEDQELERDEVDALRASKEFGRDIWEQGWAPGTMTPRPQDFRAALQLALVSLDVDAIDTMLSTEQQTHGRVDLVSEARMALTTVQSALRAAADAAEPIPESPVAKPAARAKTPAGVK